MPRIPAAVAANVRYAGALSRKLDSVPVAQKNAQGRSILNLPPLALRIRSAGVMVTKIAENRMATSLIGAKLNRLLRWIRFAVVKNEEAPNRTRSPSCSPRGQRPALVPSPFPAE